MRYPTNRYFGIATDNLDDIVTMTNQEQQYSDYEDYQAWQNQNNEDNENKEDENDSIDSLNYEDDSSSSESLLLSKSGQKRKINRENRLNYNIGDFLVVNSGYILNN